MMTFDVWIKNILDVVTRIQDAEFQERVWLRGEGPEFSSWTESICGFFDDSDADGLLACSPKETGLTEIQYSKLKEFRDALHNYVENTGKRIPPAIEILADQRWHEIRVLAQQVLNVFKK